MSRSIEKVNEWANQLVTVNEWVSDWVGHSRNRFEALTFMIMMLLWHSNLIYRYVSAPIVASVFRVCGRESIFLSTFSPCPSVLSNHTTNKVHKFVNHKYIHRSNSATCFVLRLQDAQDLYILLITLNSSADRGSILLRITGNKQAVYMVKRTVRVYFHTPFVSNLVCHLKVLYQPDHYSVQNLLSSRMSSKNLKINIYRTTILPVVLYGCEASHAALPN
jgi:hypothetical protein